MRIGVYIRNKNEIEGAYKELSLESLLHGKNIHEALTELGLTKNNFERGFIEIIDKETDIPVKIPYKKYDDFVNMLWYIRQKV